MQFFPAILIGGPPHSGKSVLTYSLTQALRQGEPNHYVLRACPDGEGDWANEITPEQVRVIRVKNNWTPEWVEHIVRDIDRRHLPLLVDVGGRPEPWQEPIINHCTHAVLLSATTEGLAQWREYAHRHGLTILAELTTTLTGEPALLAEKPLFEARLAGLMRGTRQSGPVFEALVNQLRPYISYAGEERRRLHLNTAPVELALDLDELARTLNPPSTPSPLLWQPRQLLELLNELPGGVPLGLYGRCPNWLYAAVARQTCPAPFCQFDVRLGWVYPPRLRLATPAPDSPLQVEMHRRSGYLELAFKVADGYLDYAEAEGLAVPPIPAGQPLLISGKLPHWLTTALAITYRDAPLLAVYQPMAGNVVIYSTLPAFLPGDLLPPAN
jgi:CRISPR-associated protein Csx3